MYEEYIQNMYGFPMRQYQNTYDEMGFNPYGNFYEQNMQRQEWRNTMSVEELENCYPEIYKIIYPMVRKKCMSNTMPITQTLIDNMVDEISSNIEGNTTLEFNINLGNEVCQNRELKAEEKNKQEVENRSSDEKRQIRRNPFLNDIIRILLLRELLGRPGNRPGSRPPFPPNRPGPRPPFPGGRPPMPRFSGIDDEDFYFNHIPDNKYLGY